MSAVFPTFSNSVAVLVTVLEVAITQSARRRYPLQFVSQGVAEKRQIGLLLARALRPPQAVVSNTYRVRATNVRKLVSATRYAERGPRAQGAQRIVPVDRLRAFSDHPRSGGFTVTKMNTEVNVLRPKRCG